jgi:hypothetical protein
MCACHSYHMCFHVSAVLFQCREEHQHAISSHDRSCCTCTFPGSNHLDSALPFTTPPPLFFTSVLCISNFNYSFMYPAVFWNIAPAYNKNRLNKSLISSICAIVSDLLEDVIILSRVSLGNATRINVDSPDLTRKFIGTIVEITHNRYYTHFRVW